MIDSEYLSVFNKITIRSSEEELNQIEPIKTGFGAGFESNAYLDSQSQPPTRLSVAFAIELSQFGTCIKSLTRARAGGWPWTGLSSALMF